MHCYIAFRPDLGAMKRTYRFGGSVVNEQFRRSKNVGSSSVHAKSAGFRNPSHAKLEHPKSFFLHLIFNCYDQRNYFPRAKTVTKRRLDAATRRG